MLTSAPRELFLPLMHKVTHYWIQWWAESANKKDLDQSHVYFSQIFCQ